MATIDKQIAHEIILFGQAITGLYSIYENGTGSIDPATDLRTNIFPDRVPLGGLISPESPEMNDKLLRALSNELGGRLLVSVWDVIQGTPIDDKPEGRFLRHVRNGLAHDNKFEFKSGPPENAVWRGHQLTKSEHEGEFVMTTVEATSYFVKDANLVEGYLEAGDAKELASDVMMLASN